MPLLRSLSRSFQLVRLLRRLLDGQDRQNALLTRQADALESLAASLRFLVQQQLGEGHGQGLLTGLPDGKEESGLVRTTDRELAELVFIEGELAKQLGRAPLDSEVVAAWQEYREAAGALGR